MGLIAKNTGGGDFKPPPEGTHTAICVKIIDIGTQYSNFYGKSKHKVIIGWELPNTKDDEGEPVIAWKRYTLSLHENAALRGHLEAWRGKSFTNQELEGFHLKNILGKPCLVSIVHDGDNGGRVYGNIKTIMGLPKGTPVPQPFHKLITFDIDEFDQGVFETFSESLQKTIRDSEEMRNRDRVQSRQACEVDENAPVSDDDIPF